ncbi:MAG TPA: TolC family protein [Gemmatimonadaceae bacterium]|nr:TolC family protein [Gemmatimonadaceae bacterium]
MKPSVSLCLLVAGAACVHSPPSLQGAAPAPATASTLWQPSAAVTAAARRDATPVTPPPDSLQQLTLAQVVDLALRNSPATRLSWAQARAAADVYGSSEGRYYPTLNAGITGARQLTLAAAGRTAIERTTYGPSLSLSYTVLDFGARSGTIDVARQTAIAADLAHNATVENTILQVESAAFAYLATRAERDAQKSAVALAQAALDAANERHRVGLATIADVLQAQTALSQAQLQLESLEGGLQIARGTLAVGMGLPANASYEVPDVPATDSARFVTESVDSLIAYALRSRPELAQARAQAQAAASQIRVARSGYFPSLALTGNTSNQGSNVPTFSGHSYALNLGVSVPLFNGFSNQYDAAAASENYQAALARTAQTRQQVIQQVFTSYYTLRTATDRVHTSRDLLASATQSETVARERYKEGVGSIVDLLVAQSALANARAQDIDSRWQWRTALAQLSHDVGVLTARGDTTFLTPILPAQGTK